SGNGRLAKVGTGTLILTGNNTYADGTLISGGVLQLGNGGTSGSIVGRIEVNGVLIVNRSDALTLSGIIDGAGLFVQAGTGTTTLTGANAYTNGTLISAGRLRGDSLSLQGLIQNDATLEFAQTTTGTFAGRMAGAGLVEKTGAGLLTYTGNNTFLTGQTRILGGELRVNNLLNRSSVTVGNGSTLSGTSVVGGIVAQSGGTVAPGAGGFGTLGVNGNIQFLAGSAFAAQVQPAGSDLLLGNGTAQLAGTIAVAGTAGVYRFNSVYVLLQADLGRTGTFGTETGLNTFGQAYAPRIVYTPTQVQLLLAPAQLLGIAGPDGTPNQRSTLTRIDAAVAAGYDPQPLIALYNLTPRTAFLNGADQLSGEIYATSVRAALDDDRLVREATLSRLRLTQDMGFGESFGAWGHAVGAWGSGDTDGNAARYERDQQGFVVGMDGGGTMDGGAWRVGLLGHHLTTDINVDARGSNADIERTGGGVYGGLDLGDLRIRAGGTYSSLELSGRRVAAFTGFAETLSGETDGEALQGFAEIAYRFQVGASTHLETYFLASHTRVEFDGFSETGGASRVRVAAEEDDLTTLIFGLRGGTVIPIGASTSLRLDGGLGVRHLSGDRMIFSLISLDASPNQAFDIRSAAADRFALTGNLDATFEFGRTITLSIGYSGVVAANARDHAARATLGLRF
ncbi:autotransporter outer membrane beta-barrel domain-containing protein, partial [Sphingosinicella sp.]|uniref:autotransporter outer membrane beta-barrel domain-containing protein n=1 Tax=Sphingosinicella sp. TaxID=1917971 RepID=UPI004037BB09